MLFSRKLFFVCFLLLGFLTKSIIAQDKSRETQNEWEKIVPLVTKKADVEKYFGKTYLENKYMSIYNSNFGRIFVTYYGSIKLEDFTYECNVSSDTVFSYEIALTKRMEVSEFSWNLDKFEKSPQDDGQYVYSNIKSGISFTVADIGGGKEMVTNLRYEISAENKKMKCFEKKPEITTFDNTQHRFSIRPRFCFRIRRNRDARLIRKSLKIGERPHQSNSGKVFAPRQKPLCPFLKQAK